MVNFTIIIGHEFKYNEHIFKNGYAQIGHKNSNKTNFEHKLALFSFSALWCLHKIALKFTPYTVAEGRMKEKIFFLLEKGNLQKYQMLGNCSIVLFVLSFNTKIGKVWKSMERAQWLII